MQEIPRAFVKHGGAVLSEDVTLIFGDGESYVAGYCPRRHFLSGFRNLIVHYSLEENDVMVFDYVSDSKFVVHLFKASGMQFNYNNVPGPSTNIENIIHEEDLIIISDSDSSIESELYFSTL